MNFEKEAFSWTLPIYQRWERKGYLVSSITKPCDPVIVLRRTSTSTRSIAHELFAEVLLKYRFGIIQWKMGVVIRGEVCSKKLKSSPETSMFSILVSLSYHPWPYWISHKMMIPLNRPLAWSRFDYILSSKKL